jgi:hypothetical protein
MASLIRRGEGQGARISFTADFHEIVSGKPLSGRCRVRYDPFRIVPASDYARPTPLTMYVVFHPVADAAKRYMYDIPHPLRANLRDPAGQRLTVNQWVPLPDKCDELEFWFSYESRARHKVWDSDYGKNFWIRFPLNDLHVDHAEIISARDSGQSSQFQVKISTVPAIDTVSIRWRPIHSSDVGRHRFDLLAEGSTDSTKVWTTGSKGIAVPLAPSLVFDVLYTANGHLYTDDNEGTWYVVGPDTITGSTAQ